MSCLVDRMEQVAKLHEPFDAKQLGVVMSALPAMLKALRGMYRLDCIAGGEVHCWEPDDEGLIPRKDWCATCVLLEPLFREEEDAER